MNQDYKKQIESDLKLARQRLADITAKESLAKKPEGAVLNEYINSRISQLMSKLTSHTPVTDREYLAIHGGVRELQQLAAYLNGYTVEEMESENANIESLKRQLEDLKETQG